MPYDKHCHCTPKKDKYCPVCSKYKAVYYFRHRYVSTYGHYKTWHNFFSKNDKPFPYIKSYMIKAILEDHPKNSIFSITFIDKESNQKLETIKL
jgi:hypothetical protein